MTDPTPRPQVFCIDEKGRQATVSIGWLLEHEHAAGTHPICPNNQLDVLACGEEAFGRLAQDIDAARHSVDIVTWGFDPAMELVRRAQGGAWPRGETFGELLDRVCAKGVQVRLLVWHEAGPAAAKQNNLPGYTGNQRSGYSVGRPRNSAERAAQLAGIDSSPRGGDPLSAEDARDDHCIAWWRRAMGKPRPAGLDVRLQRGDQGAPAKLLRAEPNAPSQHDGDYLGLANEKAMLEDHATHHQKAVLIDYRGDGGSAAVGYVMGLNSLTSYWDTEEHCFDDPRREVDWARETALGKEMPRGRDISRDPYRDYVCRIVGPALRRASQLRRTLDGRRRRPARR